MIIKMFTSSSSPSVGRGGVVVASADTRCRRAVPAAAQQAPGHGLAGVAGDGGQLTGALEGHDQVDAVRIVAGERGVVLLVERGGDGPGNGPAQDREPQAVGGGQGREGGSGVVGMTGDTVGVEVNDLSAH